MAEIIIDIDTEKKIVKAPQIPDGINPLEAAQIFNQCVGNILANMKAVKKSKIIKPQIKIMGGNNHGK